MLPARGARLRRSDQGVESVVDMPYIVPFTKDVVLVCSPPHPPTVVLVLLVVVTVDVGQGPTHWPSRPSRHTIILILIISPLTTPTLTFKSTPGVTHHAHRPPGEAHPNRAQEPFDQLRHTYRTSSKTSRKTSCKRLWCAAKQPSSHFNQGEVRRKDCSIGESSKWPGEFLTPPILLCVGYQTICASGMSLTTVTESGQWHT